MNKAENSPETPDIIRGLLQLERQRVVSSFAPDAADLAVESAEDHSWRERNTELHPYREIMVILKGDIPFQLASRVYEGRVGDIVLFDAFETHDRYHPPSVRDAFTLWLQIGPQMIACNICSTKDGVGNVIMRFDFSDPELCALLNQAWHDAVDARKVPEAANMAIDGIVNVVRSMFAEKLMTGAVPYNRSVKGAHYRPYPAVMAAMDYISTHIAQKPNFEELAKRVGYSKQHFARLFRQYSGYNFRDYVDHVRMLMFREMYFVKYKRKKEIARELGFSSGSALTHWLRSVRDKHPEPHVATRVRQHGDKGTI